LTLLTIVNVVVTVVNVVVIALALWSIRRARAIMRELAERDSSKNRDGIRP
jgi:cytochrome oxidase assembly protein ShyY1